METVTESASTITTELTSASEDTFGLFTEDSITDNVTELPESIYNTSSDLTSSQNEVQLYSDVFETFLILEIVMTAIELLLSSVAALKISRWRKNYRNQMLMQLSVARFVKRIINLIQYLQNKPGHDSSDIIKLVLITFQIYIDFVIIILVCFFIKHMYDSLITVIVKISKNNLYGVLCYSWLIPAPVSCAWAAILFTKVLDGPKSYLLICVLIRWPLIFLGTLLYLTVLYKVLTDRIRKFARSLTIVTFFLCLVVNFYLFSKDVIYLWCFKSFPTILTSYILGFIFNLLILCLYIILITLNFKSQSKSCNTLPNYSTATAMK